VILVDTGPVVAAACRATSTASVVVGRAGCPCKLPSAPCRCGVEPGVDGGVPVDDQAPTGLAGEGFEPLRGHPAGTLRGATRQRVFRLAQVAPQPRLLLTEVPNGQATIESTGCAKRRPRTPGGPSRRVLLGVGCRGG